MKLHEKLATIIDTAEQKLLKISQSDSEVKPAPNKWSSLELLGHLIDSAVNNSRRFVIAQIQDNLIFGGYKHEEWILKQLYQQSNWNNLINTWKVLNQHIVDIVKVIPDEVIKHQTTDHNFYDIAWKKVEQNTPSALEYFVNDYIGHMCHHLNQIFRLNSINEISDV